MTQGLPPKPTCLSIVGGILLFGLIMAAFAFLPDLTKWGGAILTFIPSQLRLIRAVSPGEVVPVNMSTSPSAITFAHPGSYALFTQNYDLLVINDAVLGANGKPWFRLVDASGQEVQITLVERGLAIYDTPFARGRPVARFEISTPGPYSMIHPRRADFTYIVPDYTFGHEGWIVFLMLLQIAAIAFGLWRLQVQRNKRRTIIVVPPPTRLARERYIAESVKSEQSAPRVDPPRPWSASPIKPVSVQPDPDARDILRLLRDGTITQQEAEAEFDHLLESQPPGKSVAEWGAKLGLTAPESAAFSQGASLSDLVAFRYDGWPTSCANCGQALNYQDQQWWFVRDERGRPSLRHIECPKPAA